jgi:RimJ/RimL family protein N-acetyltransferase
MFNEEIVQFGRIAFRPTTEIDLDCVMRMEAAPENVSFIRQWSIQQHQAAILDENVAHLIVQSTSDSKIIGYIILVGLENPDRSIEFKRIVIKKKNKRFGTESLHLVKRVAFEDLGAHRLWLEVMEHNERAIQLYKSAGFVSEGLHRESLKRGKHFLSLKVMSILAHEYNRQVDGRML